jgi:hypothetical protein
MFGGSKPTVSEPDADPDESVRLIADVLDLLIKQVDLLAERVARLERLENKNDNEGLIDEQTHADMEEPLRELPWTSQPTFDTGKQWL